MSGTDGSSEIGAVRRSESSTKKASASAASSQARSTAGRGRASPHKVPWGLSGYSQPAVVQRGTPSSAPSISAPTSGSPYRSPHRSQRITRTVP